MRTDPRSTVALAHALLLGLGPHATAEVLLAELGWSATVQALAALAEADAERALALVVAGAAQGSPRRGTPRPSG